MSHSSFTPSDDVDVCLDALLADEALIALEQHALLVAPSSGPSDDVAWMSEGGFIVDHIQTIDNNKTSASTQDAKPKNYFTTGCRECGNIGVNQTFLKSFHTSVCYRCQKENASTYSLLTQTSCLTHYLVSTSDLQTLGFIEKQNPHKDSWAKIKLFWKQQVHELAMKKYGSEENLEAEKNRRAEARIVSSDARRRAAHLSQARKHTLQHALNQTLQQSSSEHLAPSDVVQLLQRNTKGKADVTSKQRSKTKQNQSRKRSLSPCEEDAEVDDDQTAASHRSKRPTPSKHSLKSTGALHTHDMYTVSSGIQKCKTCHHTVEFEEF